jgi:translocation and assembly module TamB
VTWGAAEAGAEQVRLESAAFACSVSGTWTSPPRLADLLARRAGWTTGSLDLRAAFSSPDLGWLQASVEGLRGLRGSVAGEISVGGPVADPVYSGNARLSDGAVRYEDLPPLDAVAARASLAGRKVTLEEVGGSVGGSPFTLAGTVDLSRPADPVVDLRLKGTNALLYRAEGLRIRADNDLTLRGPVSALSLAGEVALTDSLYQRSFAVAELLSGGDRQAKSAKRSGGAGLSFPEPPLRDMRLDVRVTSREPFRIRTSAVRGSARPDLRVAGTGLLPLLRGTILFDDVNLALPSGVLEFERGSVFLSGGGPGGSALDFVGRMQTQGLEITAQIGGTIDTPEVILSSVPPVFQEELVLFVLTGAPPGSASASGGYVTAMATPMAVYLGKGVLEQLFGGGSKAGGGLQSRLEVQIGRELTRSGGVTAESRLLVKKNFARKGGSLYITAEQDKYDQDNVGLRIVFKFK